MNTLTIKECTDITVKTPAQHFLQSRFWAEFKKEQGWTYRQYEVHAAGTRSFLLTVLLRQLNPFGLLAYIPMGPSILITNDSRLPETVEKRKLFLVNLAEKLVPLLPTYVFLIRFDPPWECAMRSGNLRTFSHQDFPLIPCTGGKTPCSLRKAASDIQPPDTVLLDLGQSLDALLAQCKPKWRYNIRLAEKKGVQVRCFPGNQAEDVIPIFYRLYRETAARDGIAIHTENYYRSLCRLAADGTFDAEHILISIYIAYFEEKPLAAIITLFSPSGAVYLYGASSNEHRNLMPAYLLQWQAIQDAQKYGCPSYDFYGIPPTDDSNHPMHGLYRFKTGFGGAIIHRVGTLDIPVRGFRYCLYSCAEQLRAFWFKNLKKKLRVHSRKS